MHTFKQPKIWTWNVCLFSPPSTYTYIKEAKNKMKFWIPSTMCKRRLNEMCSIILKEPRGDQRFEPKLQTKNLMKWEKNLPPAFFVKLIKVAHASLVATDSLKIHSTQTHINTLGISRLEKERKTESERELKAPRYFLKAGNRTNTYTTT